MINLGYLGEIFPGFAFSGASDINEAGQVVGGSTTASALSRVSVDGVGRHGRPRHVGRPE